MTGHRKLIFGAFALAVVISSFWIAMAGMGATGGGEAQLAVFVYLLLVYAAMTYIIWNVVPAENILKEGIIGLGLIAIVLYAMTHVFVDYAAGHRVMASMNDQSLSIYEVLPHHVYTPELRLILDNIQIKSGSAFMMDGGIDVWVLILKEAGFHQIPLNNIPVNEPGIMYLYAFIMRLAQEHIPYLMLLTNWTAHIFSALIIYCLCFERLGRIVSGLASGLFLVSPENIYWGATIYKDGLSTLIILLIIYAFIRVREGAKYYYLLFSVALIYLAFLRSGFVVPIIVIGLLLMLVADRKGVGKRVFTYILVVVTTAVVFWTIDPQGAANNILQKSVIRVFDKLRSGSTSHLDVENITYRTTKEESLTHRVGGGDLNLSKTYFVPLRILSYLIAPFPPMHRNNRSDSFILPNTYFFSLLLVPFALGFMRSFLPSQGGVVRDLSISFVILGTAIAFAGPFVYERYRLGITPLFLIIALAYLAEASWLNRFRMILLSVALWAALLVTWILLKT